MIVTDPARLLDYNNLEQILNCNITLFPEKYFEVIRRDEDRGFLPCIIYRNGSNDTIQPDANGTINLDVMVINNLICASEYNDMRELLLDRADIRIY